LSSVGKSSCRSSARLSEGDRFGNDVAVFENEVVVAAPFHDPAGEGSSGAVFDFVFDGSDWAGREDIVGWRAADGDRATAVDLDADTLVFGTPGANDFAGAVYAFSNASNRWTEVFRHLATKPGTRFGGAVALSGDRIVIGAASDGERGEAAGAAYIAERRGTRWEMRQEVLCPQDLRPTDIFGVDVAIDGDTIIVGAPKKDLVPEHGPAWVQAGAVYVFSFDGRDWIETKLVASDAGAGDEFGSRVAICGDRIAVLAPLDDDAGLDGGSVYLFRRESGTWREERKLLPPDSQWGNAPSSLAMDERTLVIGCASGRHEGSKCGVAYWYDFDG